MSEEKLDAVVRVHLAHAERNRLDELALKEERSRSNMARILIVRQLNAMVSDVESVG